MLVWSNTCKIENAVAFDVSAVCSGFLYALNTAKAYLKANLSKRAIIVASDTRKSQTGTAAIVLFGMERRCRIENNVKDNFFNYDSELYTDGSGLDIFKVPIGSTFELDGKALMIKF